MALTREQIQQRLLPGLQGFFFTGAEQLRMTSLNSVTGVTVAIGGRFLNVDSLAPSDVAGSHTPNTDRTTASSEFGMGEGWLQSLTVIASGGSPVVGSTFVRVDVVRGSGASSTVLATLLQGFVTAGQRLAWPGSPIVDTMSGAGRFRSIVGSDPAAGAEISETVPAGARWELIAAHLLLLTDATVANRDIQLVIDDGTNIIWQQSANSVQPASSSRRVFASATGYVGGTGSIYLSLPIPPHLILQAGYRIRTNTVNLQAGDNYGAPQLLVEEWLEGA